MGLAFSGRLLHCYFTPRAADSHQAAIGAALGALRTAIHAAGQATPGWEDTSAREGVVAYELPDVKVSPVRDLVEA